MSSTTNGNSTDILAEVVYTSVMSEVEYLLAVAEVAYTLAEASVSYQAIEATDIVLAYNAKNKIIFDITEILETLVQNINKVLVDGSTVSDQSVFTLSKPAAQEIVNVFDSNHLDLRKAFNEVIDPVEFIQLTLSRNITELLSISEVFAVDVDKSVLDAIAVQDSVRRFTTFAKRFADYLVVDDISQIDKQITSDKHNAIGTLDWADYAFTKIFKDAGIISDINQLLLNKTITDSLGIPDSAVTSLQKIFSDDAISFDQLAIGTIKLVSDSANVTDHSSLSSILGVSDVIVFTDSLISEFSKSIFENATIGDVVSYAITIPYQDTTVIFDSSNIHSLKEAYDTASISDGFARTVVFNRHLYDAVAVDDIFSTEGALDLSKFNVASAVDSISSYSNKVLTDSCFITDSSAIMQQKITLDTVSAQDTYILESVKGIAENVSAVDIITVVIASGAFSKFNASAFNTSTFG